jgi:TrkA domain protein
MVIYEAEVPGVGKRFEVVTGDDDERLGVIVHHDGKREVFRRDDPDADAEKLFDLSSKQAREAATVQQNRSFCANTVYSPSERSYQAPGRLTE